MIDEGNRFHMLGNSNAELYLSTINMMPSHMLLQYK
jgi:hypothetical protein